MTSKRGEIISSVIGMFDEIDTLRGENALLRVELAYVEDGGDKQLSRLDLALMRFGRESLMKKVYKRWYDTVRVVTNDDGEIEGIETFDEWAKDVVNLSELPEWLSMADFKEICHEELLAKYEKRKEEALAAIHNEGK